MRGGKGTHKISHSSAITSSSSLLSHKKGWAGRCCGLGRKGISSPSPHTMAHVDGFPGSEVLCPDQVRSCVHSPWGLPSAQHLDIKPGSNPKTHKPTSTPAWLCFPDGYQTFIKPGSNPQTHSHFLAWLCFTSSISNLDQPPNPQPLQPGSSSPALFLQRQKAQNL